MFSEKKILVLLECTELNEYAINLENNKQPLYRPICSLGQVELEKLNTYIKTHLKTGFIWPSKSSAVALILFDKKLNNSFYLYVDYQCLNNFTIKNQYLLLLISKLLNRLDQAKMFTKWNLTSIYHQMRIKEGNKWKLAFYTQYGYFKY